MRYALVLLLSLVVGLAALSSSQAGPIRGAESTSFVGETTLNNVGGAAITSAVTGKRQVLKGFVLASDTAGVVTLFDGEGGDTIGAIYFAQNTNVIMGEDEIGEGIKSSSGNAIYASNDGAVLTGLLRLKQE